MSIANQDGSRAELERGPAPLEPDARAVFDTRIRRRQFHVWRLRRREKWTSQEIAELTGYDEGSVRRIVRQVDGWVREIFAQAGAL